MKYVKKFFYVLFSLVFIELMLRYFLGLGSPLLYEKDTKAGYLNQSSQDLHRFGNWVHINKYHQRSPEISAQKRVGDFRIMAVGDSITFGMTLVDQKETWVSLAGDLVQKCKKKSVEVLNASAGGWAIDNERGYLGEYGFFQSDLVVFEIGTNDFLQHFAPYVEDQDHPSRNPTFAIFELIDRYFIWRYLPRWGQASEEKHTASSSPEDKIEAKSQIDSNLDSLYTEIKMANAARCRVVVVQIPELREINYRHEKDSLDSRNKFLAMLEMHRVPIINLYVEWMDKSDAKDYYHDGVHLSVEGNAVLAKRLAYWICEHS